MSDSTKEDIHGITQTPQAQHFFGLGHNLAITSFSIAPNELRELSDDAPASTSSIRGIWLVRYTGAASRRLRWLSSSTGEQRFHASRQRTLRPSGRATWIAAVPIG